MEVTQRLIPPPRDDDNEEVHWALSTANALWGRGEREEALKWLRRAADQASEVEADMRAVELYKAAAEVANRLSASAAPPPPATSAPPPPATSAPPPPVATRPPAAAPAPAQPRTPSAAPPAQPRTASAVPPAPAPSRSPSGAPPAQPMPRTSSAAPPAQQPAARRQQAPQQQAPQQRAPQQQAPQQQAPQQRAPQQQARASAQPRQESPAQAQPQGQPAPDAQPRRAKQPRVVTQIGLAPPDIARAIARISPGAPAAHPDPVAYAAGPAPQAGGDRGARAPADPARYATPQPEPARNTAGPGGGAPGRHPHRWDEEVTAQRDLAALQREREIAAATAAATFAREHPELAHARVDDLDDDTRVFDDGARTDVSPLVDDALAADQAPAAIGHPPWNGAPTGESTGVGETLAEAGLAARMAVAAMQAAEDLVDTSRGGLPDPTWAADPARWHPPAPPRVPATPVEPLPSLRVAVLATSSPGEVRLVLLDERTEPPAGAAAAILVPLSAGDGAAIARLLGGG